MSKNLKVYNAQYCIEGCGSSYEEYYVIFSNTHSEALGMALELVKDSKPDNWHIWELDPNDSISHHIMTKNL